MAFSALVPKIETYNIWSSPPRIPKEITHDSGFLIRELKLDDVKALDRARPGYGASAKRYFEEGHQCVGLLDGENISAFGWYYINDSSSETRKLKGYHPLYPEHALLHADWTHPEFRGRGLHKVLVSSRLEILSCVSSVREIEAAIHPSNKPSEKSYVRAGFEVSRKLTVFSWLRFSVGRFHDER